jgi:FAS-associated factor 2
MTCGYQYVYEYLCFIIGRILSRRSITSQQSSSQQRQDPKACALRFLREFEKNYGETHVNFSQEGYSQTLEQARRELKFFLVILSSDEHDDTEQFCRHTLANEDLVEFIESKNMLVWGGNVKQVEAHQGNSNNEKKIYMSMHLLLTLLYIYEIVSDTLQATTYPFMAVIALHSVGGSAPKMAVMDRLEGSIPPATLIQRLDRTIQRHGAVMNRMKMERDQRDMERRLREEQDKAYQESLKADQEKVSRQKPSKMMNSSFFFILCRNAKHNKNEELWLWKKKNDNMRNWSTNDT